MLLLFVVIVFCFCSSYCSCCCWCCWPNPWFFCFGSVVFFALKKPQKRHFPAKFRVLSPVLSQNPFLRNPFFSLSFLLSPFLLSYVIFPLLFVLCSLSFVLFQSLFRQLFLFVIINISCFFSCYLVVCAFALLFWRLLCQSLLVSDWSFVFVLVVFFFILLCFLLSFWKSWVATKYLL